MWMRIRRWCQHHHESSAIIDIWTNESTPFNWNKSSCRWISVYIIRSSYESWMAVAFFFFSNKDILAGTWTIIRIMEQNTTGTEFSPLSTFSPKDRSLSDDPCQWMMMMESMNDGNSLFLHSFPQGQGHSGLRRRLNSVLFANLHSVLFCHCQWQ